MCTNTVNQQTITVHFNLPIQEDEESNHLPAHVHGHSDQVVSQPPVVVDLRRVVLSFAPLRDQEEPDGANICGQLLILCSKKLHYIKSFTV